MAVKVTSEVIARMLAHAEAAAPEECCGLLLGTTTGPSDPPSIDEARPAANVAADRLRHFEIDPAALVQAHRAARDGGPRLVGYYHSHPQGGARPSATDCAHASGDGRIWAIVAEGGIGFWRDGDQGFAPLSRQVEAGYE